MLKTLGGTKRNQLKADLRLTQAVLVLFLGMMLAYSATALLLPPETMKEVFYYQLEPWLHIESPDYQNLHAWTLIHHNLMVALASFILSLIYRIGGTLLVLAWNASVWGTVFAYFAQLQGNSMEAFVGDYLAMIACVFPHIVLEALGYIAATLAGLVAVRICISYGETDFKKKEAVKQLIGFAVVCVGTIFLAGTLEVTLAPFLFGLLSNT